MQEDFANSIVRAVSVSRLSPYLNQGATTQDSLAYYLWNSALSESLYPVLQGLEVTLRNSLHDSIAHSHDTEDWFELILVGQENRVFSAVSGRLNSSGKVPVPDDIVAALPLGFWVNLFFSRYEQKLWPQLLKDVFPHLPPGNRTRDFVSRRLNPIRYLRNRVFHHEPVWYWRDLEEHHEKAIEAIGWINPDMLKLVRTVDRFPDVYANGLENCRRYLLNLSDELV